MDDDFMTPPEHLYHYTSQKGLLGILESKKLWMTNILYLNDSSEFTYTINFVKQELAKRMEEILKEARGIPPQSGGILYEKYIRVDRVLNGFLSEIRIDSYVFSLSTESDDLNQWRGYCPNEGGFCIGFNHKRLLSIIENKKYKIKRCRYNREEQIELVKSLIDKISGDKLVFYNELADISTYIKHESYQNEQEYRIICHGMLDDIRYRVGKSMIIPYREFEPPDDIKLPITKVIIGPTSHPELSMMSVRSLLESNGYDIEVETSTIPHRSW